MKYKPQGLSRLLNKTLPISGDKIKNLNDMLVSMKVDWKAKTMILKA